MRTDQVPVPDFGPDTSEIEADVFGTWFARLGAIALLIGAAFGFKYAIDENIIGPGMRVLLGIVVGLTFIAWGEWAQHRNWPRLAQAVSGGGIAFLYLSTWTAFQLYGLIDGLEAFTALTIVALVGGFLAVRYEAMPLAILSTLGGFTNALLIGEGFDRPAALFGYIVILDCVVLGLAYVRRWRPLDALAFVATWLFFAAGAFESTQLAELTGRHAQVDLALAFATVYFLLFMSLTIARRTGSYREKESADLVMMVANSGLFIVFAMALLSEPAQVGWASSEQLRGPVILVAAGVHLIAGLILRKKDPRDPAAATALGSAVMLAGVWAPVELAPEMVPAAWAALGTVMINLASRSSLRHARFSGYILFLLSLVYLLGLISQPDFYDPANVLLSRESAGFVIHIAAFYAAASPISRIGDDWEMPLAGLVAGLGSVLTLLWLAFEAIAYFRPLTDFTNEQALHFTLTGTWALYAMALMVVGIAGRMVSARYLSLALFGITLNKLLLHDVWMIAPLHRTLVFIGLGIVFLACSVMYHRFRELIVSG